MRFNEWMDRVDAVHEKIQGIAYLPIIESIATGGHDFTIEIDSGIQVQIDGSGAHIRYLRSFYTHNKNEFDAMLESLEQAADTMVHAMSEILLAVTDDVVPEAVIARMRGDKVEGDTKALLDSKVTKSIGRLWDKACSLKNIFEGFRFEVEVADDELAVEVTNISIVSVQWRTIYQNGDALGHSTQCHPSTDIRENIDFLANFSLIEAKLDQLAHHMEPIREIKKS